MAVLDNVGYFAVRVDLSKKRLKLSRLSRAYSFTVLQDVQFAFQTDSCTACVVLPLSGLVQKFVTVTTFEGDQRYKSLVFDFSVDAGRDGLKLESDKSLNTIAFTSIRVASATNRKRLRANSDSVGGLALLSILLR